MTAHEITVDYTAHARLPYHWLCTCGTVGRRYGTSERAGSVGRGHLIAEAAVAEAVARCDYPVLGAR